MVAPGMAKSTGAVEIVIVGVLGQAERRRLGGWVGQQGPRRFGKAPRPVEEECGGGYWLAMAFIASLASAITVSRSSSV